MNDFLFKYDGVLRLVAGDLALDARRRQVCGFVSHAHYDHMARHGLALCTEETSRLYQLRMGVRATRILPYFQPHTWHDVELTTYPAGHCLGSAMLLVNDGRSRLLFTGDFKLGPSETAAPAVIPRAEVLIMETTFGDRRYRLPPRDEVVERLVTIVRDALDLGKTPVIIAYPLGKSQEVTCLLTRHGIPVLQHQEAFRVSEVYRQCGVELGECRLFSRPLVAGRAVILPPGKSLRALPPRETQVRIAVTGWAAHPATQARLGVDHALPLSDHADYDQLWQAIEQATPRVIYCTHGPASFVDDLRAAGLDARLLSAS